MQETKYENKAVDKETHLFLMDISEIEVTSI